MGFTHRSFLISLRVANLVRVAKALCADSAWGAWGGLAVFAVSASTNTAGQSA